MFQNFVTEKYWAKKYSTALPILDLYKSPRKKNIIEQNKIEMEIPSDVFSKIDHLTSKSEINQYIFLYTILCVLLNKYTLSEDFLIASPSFNLKENRVPGNNTMLFLRTSFKADELSVKELLNECRKTIIEAYKHQEHSYIKFLEDKGKLSENENYLFQLAFIDERLSNSLIDFENKFPLVISILPAPNSILLSCKYKGTYEEGFIASFIRHFVFLCGEVIDNLELSISEIELNLEERNTDFFNISTNKENSKLTSNLSIQQLFKSAVRKKGDKIAIKQNDLSITYQELDELSDKLATYLVDKKGLKQNQVVGISLPSSFELIISILGVLKAGAVVMPIDVVTPIERILFQIKDSNCSLFISEFEMKNAVLLNYLSLNDLKSLLYSSCVSERIEVVNNEVAYIIYTSGSTGQPKGVKITNQNILHQFHWFKNYFNFSEDDVLPQKTTIGFVDSIIELLFPITFGESSIYLRPFDKISFDNHQLLKWFIEIKATIVQFVPMVFNEFQSHENIENVKSLKHLILTGEELKERYFFMFNIYNIYGSSECTAYSLVHKINNETIGKIPIGKPVGNTYVYILGKNKEILPTYVCGEIFIGGDMVTLGYINNCSLTAERFIPDPFLSNRLIYKSGDYGRLLPNGEVEYLGRMDNQIKIRGCRIELGEIEEVLKKYQGVNQAIVVAKPIQNQEKELVAYLTCNGTVTTNELGEYVKELVPSYMVPNHFVVVGTLPLTSTGKIDRKTLSEMEIIEDTQYQSPIDETEKKLMKVWERLLKKSNIGRENNFFKAGGNSLKITQLLNTIKREFEVEIDLIALFNTPILKSQAQLITNSKKHSFSIIPVAPRQLNYPLSFSQKRLWILSHSDDSHIAYNVFGSINLEGVYELALFQRSFESTIERHEILRTVFKEDATGEIKQWIVKKEDLSFNITYKDFRKEKNTEEQIKKYIAADSHKAFDLVNGPLFRAGLLQLEDERYVFYFNIHHIISDGWSMDVLSKDVLLYYEAFKRNKEPELKPLMIQYKDYSVWQLAKVQEESFTDHKNYWLNNLSGELSLLDLPTKKKRPPIKTYNGQSLSTYIDQPTMVKLKNYSETNGGSLFMVLLAAWNVLMYRYTDQKDIIIGTPIAGREHADLEDQIGFYVNTLAIRNEIKSEENFNAFYNRLRENTLRSYSHQIYPFDRLVEELPLKRDISRSAVFDVMLVLQNAGENEEEVALEKEFNLIVDQGDIKSKFDIEIIFKEVEDYLSMHVVYNPDVYEKEMVEGLVRHYKQIINAALDCPEEKISQVDYLSESEKHELLFTFNDTAASYPNKKTIVELFEEQVAKTPNHTAVIFEGKALTYKYLKEQSNQLAHYLQKHYTIQPNDLIGIKLERSEWMLISILGILKSGGAYVPIDPEYPHYRIDYILKDSNCKLLIDERELEKFKEQQNKYSKKNPLCNSKSSDLAYVIYTSGSTGQPKGCMLEHKGVINRIEWMWNHYNFNPEDTILQKTTFTFDVSVWEIFMPLCWGAKMVLCQKEDISSPERILDLIDQHKITCLHFVPSMLNAFIGSLFDSDAIRKRLKSLRNVIASGEALPKETVKKWYDKVDIPIHNLYGPTEASVDVTHYTTSKDDIKIPIGAPIWNTQMYVLDQEHSLVPVGVVGEICIGGDGLARGYLSKPELTQEKFIISPFKKDERIYKTGDLGRWTKDGNIEFIGRKDDQVKIRGYRIELGEIESVLQSHKNVSSAVVLASTDKTGEKRLVAYILIKGKLKANELRSYLKNTLPDYMLPAHYIELEQFPLTPSGKIDKKNLPEPEGMSMPTGIEYVAARTAIEKKLVEIWEEILGREKIGIKDNFFEQGGHSLKAVRLINRYGKELGVKMSLKDLFTDITVESQAVLIQTSQKSEFVQIEKVSDQSSYPISDGQRRIWVLSQFEESSVAYNIIGSIYLNEEVDIDSFKRAIDSTIDRHEILRTVFKEDENGEIRQWVLDKEVLGFKIDCKDFRARKNKEELVRNYIAEDSYEIFDLRKGPLLRASLMRLENACYIFYCSMHHIIGDGWSMEVLKKDVFSYYGAYKRNKEPELKPLRIQYKDYSTWQLAQVEKEFFKVHRAYWLENLSGELPLLDLPSIKRRPRVKTNNGRGLSAYIDSSTTVDLKKYVEGNGGSLFMGLLAVWNVLMYRYSGQQDIIIGTPVAGREHADLEDQIGFYLNTLALRNEIKPEESFNEFYNRLKENTLTSYNHQRYPFDRLVEELSFQRDASRNAVFDVMLILQNNGEKGEDFDLKEEELNQITDQGDSTSTFDIRISIEEIGDYLSLQVVYNRDVYEGEMVERLIRHYRQLLKTVLASPSERISETDYLSKEEKQELLVAFYDTKIEYPKEKTIVDLFEEQVLKTPNLVALIFEEKKLTYRELDELSNQLAHYLKKNYKIKSDDLIGIKLERSEWMIISILGVLKSGGGYVPIDPTYPQERIDYIEKDTKCRVCIDGEELRKFSTHQREYLKERINSKIKPGNLAYVIYTSGSTGRPKGVMIEHSNVVRLFKTNKPLFDFNDSDVWTMFHSYAFDFSVWEMYGALLFGGKLIVVSKSMAQDASLYMELLENEGVTVLNQTPSAFYILSKEAEKSKRALQVRYVIFGGEALNPGRLQNWQNCYPLCQLINMYGITETTVHTTYKQIKQEDIKLNRSNIGKAIPTVSCMILDENKKLVSIGITGELYIGGEGVARGYLNQKSLTNEKFIPNPFVEGERLYRTGDKAKQLSNGDFEYLGRLDDQVKIRGYRIELGEIEHALLNYKSIEETVVIAKENQDNEKEIVAYITSKSVQNTSELRSYLKKLLPEYMVPSYYVQLESMPMTKNGKIDKKALPDPAGLNISSGVQYVGPRNEIEEKLVKIWEEVLKRKNIGIKDDFFELGGHSLKIIKVINQVNKQFGLKYDLKGVYTEPTIESMSRKIKTDIWFKESKVQNENDYTQVKI